MLLLINNLSDSITQLKNMLEDVNIDFQIKSYDSNFSFKEFNSIIISGRNKYSKLTNKINSNLIKLAINDNLPILGICYGAEILALNLNCTLKRMTKPLNEIVKISINVPNPLTDPYDKLNMYCKRAFQIFRLSKEVNSYSSSVFSDNEIIKHVNYNMFGLQFHPELSGPIGKQIINNFINIVKK